MKEKKIEVKDVKGIVNAERGTTIHQHFHAEQSNKKYYYLGAFLLLVVLVSIGVGISINYDDDKSLIDLNGEWIITDTLETGKYKNTTIGFQVLILQNGKNFVGEGEKITVNGKDINQKEKSRLKLVEGSIQSDMIKATFIEYGRKRETRGIFKWTIIENEQLHGQFISTANSRGKSIVIKNH